MIEGMEAIVNTPQVRPVQMRNVIVMVALGALGVGLILYLHHQLRFGKKTLFQLTMGEFDRMVTDTLSGVKGLFFKKPKPSTTAKNPYGPLEYTPVVPPPPPPKKNDKGKPFDSDGTREITPSDMIALRGISPISRKSDVHRAVLSLSPAANRAFANRLRAGIQENQKGTKAFVTPPNLKLDSLKMKELRERILSKSPFATRTVTVPISRVAEAAAEIVRKANPLYDFERSFQLIKANPDCKTVVFEMIKIIKAGSILGFTTDSTNRIRQAWSLIEKNYESELKKAIANKICVLDEDKALSMETFEEYAKDTKSDGQKDFKDALIEILECLIPQEENSDSKDEGHSDSNDDSVTLSLSYVADSSSGSDSDSSSDESDSDDSSSLNGIDSPSLNSSVEGANGSKHLEENSDNE